MVDVLDRYARENGYAVVLDSSAQSTPILYASTQIDVTQDIVPPLRSGLPGNRPEPAAPAKPAAAKPAPAGVSATCRQALAITYFLAGSEPRRGVLFSSAVTASHR